MRVEAARGAQGQELRTEILTFWAENGALEGREAEARLDEVLCVLRDEEGSITGVNSAVAANVPVVGDRRFWVYRSFLVSSAAGSFREMIRCAFDLLAADFDPGSDDPIGLCVLVGADEAAAHPDVEWQRPRMIYAGYGADGRQVRVGYFKDAVVGPGAGRAMETWNLADGYRVEPLWAVEGVSAQDVVDLWLREGVVDPQEARRRIGEVLLVGTSPEGELVGVSSAYLEMNAQLRMPLWYYRAFTADSHRRSNVAVTLALRGRDLLKQRFTSGEDTRGAGIIYEVENEALKRYFNPAHWWPTDFLFIGENQGGDHVRVHWFPGAKAPR